MKEKKIKLLTSLIEIPSPSGFEEKIAQFIQRELLTVLPKNKVKIDFQNNVVAKIKGTSDYTVMIDAHLDQIAYIVNNPRDILGVGAQFQAEVADFREAMKL